MIIYKTTNLNNGKIYIGKDTGKKQLQREVYRSRNWDNGNISLPTNETI